MLVVAVVAVAGMLLAVEQVEEQDWGRCLQCVLFDAVLIGVGVFASSLCSSGSIGSKFYWRLSEEKR